MIIKEKDTMWYVKSITDIIILLIFMVCLVGFIGSWFVFIWNKELANVVMGWSVGVGFFNLLILVSCDKEWRRDYRDTEDANKFD